MGFEADFEEALDHEVSIGRPSMDETDADKVRPVRTVTEVETGVPMALQEVRGSRQQREYGVITQATHQGFVGPDRDVQEGDLIRADSGPEAGNYFTVGAVYSPLSHHRELTLEMSTEEKRRAAEEPWT